MPMTDREIALTVALAFSMAGNIFLSMAAFGSISALRNLTRSVDVWLGRGNRTYPTREAQMRAFYQAMSAEKEDAN
jgi:hypothetical protein